MGETDDLVMSTILAVRMAMEIARLDGDAYENLRDSFDETEFRQPLPFIVLM